MIQTKTPTVYGDRDERKGIIMVEVRPQEMTKEGTNYLVIDWDISKNPPEAWKSKVVFYNNEKLIQLDQYLESAQDFSGLNRVEKEWLKVKLALMIDTQTNLLENGKTIYGLNPGDWEFSE